MSTTVPVNIDIADVNDNAPVFSPENASAVIQVCAQGVSELLHCYRMEQPYIWWTALYQKRNVH